MATLSMTNASFEIHAVIFLNRYLIKTSFTLIIRFRIKGNTVILQYYTITLISLCLEAQDCVCHTGSQYYIHITFLHLHRHFLIAVAKQGEDQNLPITICSKLIQSIQLCIIQNHGCLMTLLQ